MFSKKFASNYLFEDLLNIFKKATFKCDLTENDIQNIKAVIQLYGTQVDSTLSFQKLIVGKLQRLIKPKILPKNEILRAYKILKSRNEIDSYPNIRKFGTTKETRGNSGIQSITIMTSGVQFGNSGEGDQKDIEDTIKRGGCPMDCHFCPFEKDADGIPTQPRSYLSTEPANQRASDNKHHPAGQVFDRLHALEEIGHIPSLLDETLGAKLEMIISGGTFNFYPHDYLEWFVTCMYYACNIYYQFRETFQLEREMLSLEEEQEINRTAYLRVIGLTIETRPDYIDPIDFKHIPKKVKDLNTLHTLHSKFDVVRFFRKLGVTRVQIGVQHTDDDILKFVNRQCTDLINRKAIRFLKDNCFKVDIHLMPDLPSSSVEKDIEMFNKILTDPAYHVDQWKIYPTMVTDFTKIKTWYDNGDYVPYAEADINNLIKVVSYVKERIHPWIRINRIVRDIPVRSVIGGIRCPDFRVQLEKEMKTHQIFCKCIRCREIGSEQFVKEQVKLLVRKFDSNQAIEYFISYEMQNNDNGPDKLIGFIRLRLVSDFSESMPELHGYAFVRELHVYGQHTNINSIEKGVQHQGYGTLLLKKAEEIALQNGYKGVAIISGVGVQEYYKKKGYSLENTFMVKKFNKHIFNNIYWVYAAILICLFLVVHTYIFC